MAREAITRAFVGATALLLASSAAWALAGSAQAAGPPQLSRYDLAGDCFAMRSNLTGGYVAKAGGGYEAKSGFGGAERFRMQATDLGKYLFYGPAPDFLARTTLNAVAPAAEPSDDADWTINESGVAFTIVNEAAGRDLAVDGAGALTTVPEGSGGNAGRFTFDAIGGCADYPEIEVNVNGEPPTSDPSDPVHGTVEGHMHQMAYEFLGTKAHCGRPWHRFGAPYALQDCVDHGDTDDPSTEGCAAVLETAVSGTTCHDTDGWPTFAGWPEHYQLTHEQSYYKWLERSWRAGTRIFVNLLVENRVLCEIYPLTPGTHDCNEMESVRRQAQRMRELERYVDAQSGGPGEGWYRIVESPAEARQVIADGKLAVVMGMEVSEPFDCRIFAPTNSATCDEDDIDASLDEIYDLGVRQLEIINKFDNGLGGVAGDGGNTGTLTNGGNWLSTTGRFWDLGPCEDPDNHDHTPTAFEHNDDALIANGLNAYPFGGPAIPAYGPPPHCNQLGLTPLGEHAIRKIMEKKMIFDPDHLSVIARNESLDLTESENYPGLISSHSWSTPNATPRILGAGGLITPYAGSSQGFVNKWADIKAHGYDQASPYFGFGYGADMNGLGSQGGPRSSTAQNPPVSYPFQSPIYPNVTVCQQQSGDRTYDINSDGVAHYGLYADWLRDLEILGGPELVEDMARGAEAYLRTWERATGVRSGASAPGGRAGEAPKPRAELETNGCADARNDGGNGGGGNGGGNGGGAAGGEAGAGGGQGGKAFAPGRCANPLRGTHSRNFIKGTAGGDRILGLRGGDRIKGKAGDDCLRGNRGPDLLKGGPGRDLISGSAGRDRLIGGAGTDFIKGGLKRDVIKVRDGNRDVVNCGPGRDVVLADKHDKLHGCEVVKRR